MEETIHINLGAAQTDTHNIQAHTVRIWPRLLATVNWIFKNPVPGNLMVQHGISITMINNLAMAVEGFVADLCWEQMHSKNYLKGLQSRELDRMTWNGNAKKKGKVELYNELFTKKLEQYYGFDDICVLISFRNNLAHGRTYTELTEREIVGKHVSNVSTGNKVYQELRDYLIARGMLESRTTFSNVEVPWKIKVACHFAGLVKFFIQNVLKENESSAKSGIEAEFKLAYK